LGKGSWKNIFSKKLYTYITPFSEKSVKSVINKIGCEGIENAFATQPPRRSARK
jgi:hypothetical protein